MAGPLQKAMKRRSAVIGVCAGVIILLGAWLVCRASETAGPCIQIAHKPNIAPDYSDIVIPCNIAPLNFRILEKGRAYRVKIHSDRGPAIEISDRMGSIRISAGPWRALLDANRGREVFVDVYVKNADGQWLQFQRITNAIAEESIDETLVYRLMRPIFNAWKDIGIYQRDLANYDASLVLHGRSFGEGCLNCHSFIGNSPDT